MVTSRASKNLRAQTVCKKEKLGLYLRHFAFFPKGKISSGFKELGKRCWRHCACLWLHLWNVMILAFFCVCVCVCEFSICKWGKVLYLLSCVLKTQHWFLCARCQHALILHQSVGMKACPYHRGVARITLLLHREIWYRSDKDTVNIYTDRASSWKWYIIGLTSLQGSSWKCHKYITFTLIFN